MKAALFPDLIVNGELVPHTLIAAETQNQSAPRSKPGLAWRKAARAMAVRTLLLQEARKHGLTADPDEVDEGRFETNEEALIRAILERAVQAKAPSEQDIRAEWQRNPDRFRSPPLWEVSHILCACDPHDEDARQAAQQRAEALVQDVHARPTRFAQIAADHSDCGSKSSGGALGQLGPGDTVPEFEAALRELSDGEITASPILSRHGWHIIRMDAIAEGAVLPFETARHKISEAMEKASWAREAQSFVNQLVAIAEISGADFRPLPAEKPIK